MIVTCPACNARYRIRKKIEPRGARMSCPACAKSFVFYPDDGPAPANPLRTPGPAPISAVPEAEQSLVGIEELSQITGSWPLPPRPDLPPTVRTIVPMERRSNRPDDDEDDDAETDTFAVEGAGAQGSRQLEPVHAPVVAPPAGPTPVEPSQVERMEPEPEPEHERRILARQLLAEEGAAPPRPRMAGWLGPAALVGVVLVAVVVCSGIGAGLGLNLGSPATAVVAPAAAVVAPEPVVVAVPVVAPAPPVVVAPEPLAPTPVAVAPKPVAVARPAPPRPAVAKPPPARPAPVARPAPQPALGVSTSDLVDPFSGQ